MLLHVCCASLFTCVNCFLFCDVHTQSTIVLYFKIDAKKNLKLYSVLIKPANLFAVVFVVNLCTFIFNTIIMDDVPFVYCQNKEDIVLTECVLPLLPTPTYSVILPTSNWIFNTGCSR